MSINFGKLKVCGIDAESLGQGYEEVRGTFLRSNGDVLVISKLELDDADTRFVQLAHASGHVVCLVPSKHQAPAGTEWVTNYVP